LAIKESVFVANYIYVIKIVFIQIILKAVKLGVVLNLIIKVSINVRVMSIHAVYPAT
jgi:hypothetical protein